MEQAHHLVHSLKGVAGNLAATNLEAAAIGVEKLVRGASPDKLPSREDQEPKLAALEKALNEALESAQTLGPAAAADQSAEASSESMASVAVALDQDIAERIREAAEMGDMNQLKTIADKLKSQSDSLLPFYDKIIQMAEDFDFDGIIDMVSEIEKTQN